MLAVVSLRQLGDSKGLTVRAQALSATVITRSPVKPMTRIALDFLNMASLLLLALSFITTRFPYHSVPHSGQVHNWQGDRFRA